MLAGMPQLVLNTAPLRQIFANQALIKIHPMNLKSLSSIVC